MEGWVRDNLPNPSGERKREVRVLASKKAWRTRKLMMAARGETTGGKAQDKAKPAVSGVRQDHPDLFGQQETDDTTKG